VKIRDENTTPPKFTQDSYSVSIAGSQKLGTSILAVSATDEDDGAAGRGRITYDIEDGKDANL